MTDNTLGFTCCYEILCFQRKLLNLRFNQSQKIKLILRIIDKLRMRNSKFYCQEFDTGSTLENLPV